MPNLTQTLVGFVNEYGNPHSCLFRQTEVAAGFTPLDRDGGFSVLGPVTVVLVFCWFFVYHLKKQVLIPRFSHADSWLVATTRFCTAISVSTAWGWGYNSIFRCSRSRLFFCAASLLLLEVAAVVETTLFVFLCLRKAY